MSQPYDGKLSLCILDGVIMANFLLDWQELLKYRRKALFLSILVIVLGLMGLFWRGGLLYGIDFTGGFRLLFEFSTPVGPQKMEEIRTLFDQNLEAAKVNTYNLGSEKTNRGLMVTVRGKKIVDNLTNALYNAGRSGNEAVFEDLAGKRSEFIIDKSTLEENFRLGSGAAEKINLANAGRADIQERVQTIVNESVTNGIIQLLKDDFTSPENKIDLNWAGKKGIQSWLVEAQLAGFIQEFQQLRKRGRLDFSDELGRLLERFALPPSDFREIFTTNPEEDEKLYLPELEPSALREVLKDEYFQGRYQELAGKVVEHRSKRSLFQSVSEVLQLSSLQRLYKPTLAESSFVSPFILLRSEMISPAIGADLIRIAALAILISLIGILAYLYVRFELTYSLAAIAAIIHDVLITVGLLTLLGIEFDVPVVAAVLTVIGYSLNDTIVNFDRVRENKVLMGYKAEWYEVINRSVYEVLNRTLVTSLTTFVAVLFLFLYGGLVLRAFSITLLIGVITGTYSSVFVSNSSLLQLQQSLKNT